jgi:C4-type Zn-finger protein
MLKEEIMGAAKQMLFDEMDREDDEVVVDCPLCDGGVTSSELNDLPFDGGVPAYVICRRCQDAEHRAQEDTDARAEQEAEENEPAMDAHD